MPTNLLMVEATYDDYVTPAFGRCLNAGAARTPLNYLPSLELVFDMRLSSSDTTGSVQVAMGQEGFIRMGKWSNGNAFARYGSGPEINLSSSVALDDGLDHHLRLDLTDGGKLFVDGVLASSNATLVTASGASLDPTKRLSIREWSEGFGVPFNGEVAEVAIFTSAQNVGDFTPPAAPYTGSETDLYALWHMEDSGSDTVGAVDPDVVVSCDDAAIFYSPMNWVLSATKSLSNNAGAYFKTIFKSSTCKLVFNNSSFGTGEITYIVISVDKMTYQRVQIDTYIDVTIPTGATGTDSDTHLLEVYIDSTHGLSRWTNPPAVRANFMYLELDKTATVEAATLKPKRALIYGDSIGEGIFSLGNTLTNTLDNSSAYNAFPRVLFDRLGCEYGAICFSAQGFQSVGGGGVPALVNAWDLQWTSTPRDFTSGSTIDYLILEMGTNDLSADTVTDGVTVINGLLTELPNAVFFLLRPFNGTAQESNLQSIQSTCSDPSRVFYVDTDGFFDSTQSPDALHPYMYAHVGPVANNIADFILNPPNVAVATLAITGIPDGTYRTQLFYGLDLSTNLFFDQDVAYSSGSATVTVGDIAGRDIIGVVLDNEAVHVDGAAISVTTS